MATRVAFFFTIRTALSVLYSIPAYAAQENTHVRLMRNDVFVGLNDDYHHFRTPSVVVSNDGTVLEFCEGYRHDTGRLEEMDGDIDIVLKRSFDGGKTWGKLQVVCDEASDSCTSPTVVVDRQTGTLWLHLRWNEYADTMQEILSGHTLRVPHGYLAFVC